MKHFICGAEIMVRVVFADLDRGEWQYLMDLHNVQASCRAKPSASLQYGGNMPATYTSARKLPFENGMYHWAKVWAECEKFDAGCADVGGGCVKQVGWTCEVTRIKLIK